MQMYRVQKKYKMKPDTHRSDKNRKFVYEVEFYT